MARISGVDLPRNKRMEIALTHRDHPTMFRAGWPAGIIG